MADEPIHFEHERQLAMVRILREQDAKKPLRSRAPALLSALRASLTRSVSASVFGPGRVLLPSLRPAEPARAPWYCMASIVPPGSDNHRQTLTANGLTRYHC